MGIQYKREIDGLRAVAVLSVVLYHAGVVIAGYAGVDVFFVISGYLITSILVSQPRIDLLAFYARRVRRILPAAAVVVLTVLAFSWLLPVADAQQDTAKSAGAALLFVANVYFEYTTGGYWDRASVEMPLLHLWSLSVEEQFYFFWPALLLFTRSRKAIAALAIASFVLAEYWMLTNPEAAFYRMPARFWELAAGGLIALSPAWRVPRWVGLCGLVLTIGSCLFVTPSFPAAGALPVVLGTSVVIAYVHGGGTNRFLASKPMVAVGLVSYSLYLWHWPLLAFYRANGGDSLRIELALCAFALVLAALTWRFVEQPARRMRFPSGRTVAAGAAASALLALSACAFSLHEPAPPPPNSKEALAEFARNDHLSRKCEIHEGEKVSKCLQPLGAQATFWGDSMALSWSAGAPGSAVYSFPGCVPVMGRRGGRRGCGAFNDQVVHNLKGDTLYIAARWAVYGPTVDITPTLEAVRGMKRVVVIGPSPFMQADADKCIRGEAKCGLTRAAFERESGPIIARLREQAKPFPNVEVWDVSRDFCATDCPVVLDGVALYHDINHPSVSQARRVFGRRIALAADARG